MSTPALDNVVAEEESVRFSAFDLDDAWELGCRMRRSALAKGLPLAIGIVHGHQRAFHSALPGSYAENDAWLTRKINVAQRYGRSSLGVLEFFAATGRDFDTQSRLPVEDYAAAGGVVPLVVHRVGIVGYAGVSGMPHRDDHAFVIEQLREFGRR